MTTTNNTPRTLDEALDMGYRTIDQQFQRGYVSRRQDPGTARIHVAGGKRRGELYVLLPAYSTSQYCIRQYLARR